MLFFFLCKKIDRKTLLFSSSVSVLLQITPVKDKYTQ